MKISHRRIRIFLIIISVFTCFNAYAEVVLEPFDSKPVTLSSLKGKWVYLHYWASWCPPCLKEIPIYNSFYKQVQNAPVALFAVNYDWVEPDVQRALMNKYKIKFPALRTDPSEVLGLSDVSVLPATYIYNPEGKLIKVLYGSQTLASLWGVMKQG